jgi:hypothetical protein
VLLSDWYLIALLSSSAQSTLAQAAIAGEETTAMEPIPDLEPLE